LQLIDEKIEEITSYCVENPKVPNIFSDIDTSDITKLRIGVFGPMGISS
jgi:hypothetical protein